MNIDLTPLFRSSIGYDRVGKLLDSATRIDDGSSYPPYNIEKHQDNLYRITLAVAGFSDEDLDIQTHESLLIIRGRIKNKDTETPSFLHRGIASRSFERRFYLAEHIRVVSAEMDKGLLHIELFREIPESLKPKSIPISSAKKKEEKTKFIEG